MQDGQNANSQPGFDLTESARWALGAGAACLFTFLIFAISLWKTGMLTFAGTDSSAKVVAASLALIGGFIGSVVAFVGLVFTHAIQLRAEKRQRVEAVIGALGLLATPTGGDVSVAQRAGVLFALDSLDMPQLALTLLNHMLSTGTVDVAAACQIIDRGLRSRDDDINEEAANSLYAHVEKFAISTGYVFPRSVDMAWSIEKPEMARELVALSRLRLIRCRPFSEWNQGDIFSHTAALAEIWRTDTSERIRRDVGIFLSGLLVVYQAKGILYTPSGPLNVDDLRSELQSSSFSKGEPTALASEFIGGLAGWLKT